MRQNLINRHAAPPPTVGGRATSKTHQRTLAANANPQSSRILKIKVSLLLNSEQLILHRKNVFYFSNSFEKKNRTLSSTSMSIRSRPLGLKKLTLNYKASY